MASASRIPALVTVFGIIAVLGYGQDAKQSAAQAQDLGAVVDGVYRVECTEIATGGTQVGTAFGHRSRLIITAAHVVDGCDSKTLHVIDSSMASTTITKILSDKILDVAVLTPSTIDFVKVALELSSATQVTIPSRVFTWGFPAGYSGKEALPSIGYLAGAAVFDGVKRWVINAAINGGNSGGPLLDMQTTKVIGVVSAKYAPGATAIKTYLVNLEKTTSGDTKQIIQIIRHLNSQTQLVIGVSVFSTDLQKFLKQHGIEP